MQTVKRRSKGFLVALVVILLNLLLVTQVVGLSYNKFNWRHYFAPVAQGDDDPYDDDGEDDDDQGDVYEEGDEDEPYAPYEETEVPAVVPTAEPYTDVTTEPYTDITVEPYTDVTTEPYPDVTPTAAEPPTEAPTVVYEQVDAPTSEPSEETPQETPAATEEAYEDVAPPEDTTPPPDPGLLGGEGFLGTNASFRIDLTLVLEILLWLGLIVGVVVQRQNKWKYHDWIATSVVVANLFLIAFIMFVSFKGVSGGIPNDLGQPFILFPTIHAVLGTIGEGIGVYCLLAGHQILPRHVGRLRYWMWTAFGFWTAAVVLGVATYFVFYVPTGEASEEVAGVTETATEEAAVLEATATTPPTETPVPTETAVPPTDTPAPTDTPVPPTETPVPIPADMRLITGGPFLMGSSTGQADEAPEHEVILSDFLMDVYEISNGQYSKCVEAGACTPPAITNSFTHPNYYNNPEFVAYPVMGVNWDQAVAYCGWVERRLPTEAEWEYAASGPENFTWPWGNTFDPALSAASASDIQPVFSYPEGASYFGILNMAGNVTEWVVDVYDPSFYANSPAENPVNLADGPAEHVHRGGSFSNTNGEFYTTSRRYWHPNTYADVDIGFRCAADLP